MVDLADASDAALMAEVELRDEAALAELFARHSEAVRRHARRTCGAALADDVVQEVFLRIWERPGRYDAARGGLRSYLLTSAYGRSVDLLRSGTARTRREIMRPPRVVAESAAPGDLGDGTWELLAQLPRPQREAIVLAYLQGHSYGEVAALLGVPLGTVKSRVRTGLNTLHGLISEAPA